MKKFSYKAKDWTGKSAKGVIEAVNRAEVVSSLRGHGLIPLEVNEISRSIITEVVAQITGRVNLKQVATFTRQLSTMMNAGLPLTDALSLLKNQNNEKQLMYHIVEDSLNTVRSGLSLGVGLEKYKNVFGEAYIASIKAGEEGGVLEEVLKKLADNLEQENEFRGKVKGAMIYPVIVVIGMIGVAIIMMIFVIPKLMGLYGDFGTKMPASTRALMAVSSAMGKVWFIFPISPLLIMAGLKVVNQNPKLKLKKDAIVLKIPIMGDLTNKTILANTMRTLSMLLEAGISLTDGLRIVSRVADNELYSSAFIRISERVEKGFPVSNSFEEMEIFPMIVNQMVATGEATGKLGEVLMRVSDYFSTEAEQSVKSLTSAIEPLIMIVLGIGVAFLIIAVIMPIYNLTSQF
jgi:type IV pilus assembly protein PilC